MEPGNKSVRNVRSRFKPTATKWAWRFWHLKKPLLKFNEKWEKNRITQVISNFMKGMKIYGSFNASIVIKKSVSTINGNTKNVIITEAVSNAALSPKDHGTRCAIGLLRTLSHKTDLTTLWWNHGENTNKVGGTWILKYSNGLELRFTTCEAAHEKRTKTRCA